MSDCKSISRGCIIAFDDVEVVDEQERWTIGASRNNELGRVFGARKCPAAGPLDAQRRPLLKRAPGAAIGESVIKTVWQHHLIAPGFTFVPAFLGQEIRG